MRSKRTATECFVWLSTLVLMVAGTQLGAQAAGMKFEAILVWGTDDAKPPEGKNYQPVEPAVKQKLKALKWANWFEVSRTNFTVAPGITKKVAISAKCEIEVKTLGNSADLEVALIGKGKEVMRRKQSLPSGDLLVLGGDAPNATAWAVILKRTE